MTQWRFCRLFPIILLLLAQYMMRASIDFLVLCQNFLGTFHFRNAQTNFVIYYSLLLYFISLPYKILELCSSQFMPDFSDPGSYFLKTIYLRVIFTFDLALEITVTQHLNPYNFNPLLSFACSLQFGKENSYNVIVLNKSFCPGSFFQLPIY